MNFGTDLENPDFAALAQSIGLYGVRVEKPDELDAAVRDALDHPGPAVVDVVDVAPGTVTAAEDHGRADQGVHALRRPYGP